MGTSCEKGSGDMPRRCNLITDSCCDLTKEYLDDNEVTCLHFSYVEADKEDGGLSGTDDLFQARSAHEFYEAIRKGATPMTSQPSQGEFDKVFRAAIDSGIPTVYLAFSSGISGCYDGAMAVLGRLKEEKGADIPLYIVDLRVGSTTQSLFITEAVRQRDKGLTAQQLVRWAEEARYYVHTTFMVDDLNALKRGGRIPSGVAAAGSLLDVKPLLTFDLDGKLSIMGVARGRKKAIRKMAEFYEKNHNTDIYSAVAAIGNADCPHDVERLEDLIHKTDDSTRFIETSIGPTIGCHVGPGMMSCCFWGDDRRKGISVQDRIANDVRKS
jgi:DegV family protein with EDD domain